MRAEPQRGRHVGTGDSARSSDPTRRARDGEFQHRSRLRGSRKREARLSREGESCLKRTFINKRPSRSVRGAMRQEVKSRMFAVGTRPPARREEDSSGPPNTAGRRQRDVAFGSPGRSRQRRSRSRCNTEEADKFGIKCRVDFDPNYKGQTEK